MKARWDERDARRLAEVFAAGGTFADGANATGRSLAAVKAYVRSHGGKAAVAARPDVPDVRLRELFDAGLPYEAIAKETGLTKGTVTVRCRALGLRRTLEDGPRMRGAMEAWREGRAKPAANRAWHVQGDGPLARRFNAQQDEVWANGGPKPVRLKNNYYKEACFEF